MKKYILGLMLLWLAIASCKKDHSNGTASSGTLHKVSFSVAFTKQITDYTTNSLKTNGLATDAADTALTNHINTLLYAVYNSSGAFVHQVTQSSTDSSFGNYTENLASGNYTIVIAGGSKGLVITSPYATTAPSSLNTDVLSYGGYQSDYWNGFIYDTFFKKLSITVSNTDMAQNVSLARITSKIELIIKDAIPAKVTNVQTSIIGAADRFQIGTATGQGEGNLLVMPFYHKVNNTDIGATNYTVNATILYYAPLSVDIAATSGNPPTTNVGAIYAEKVVPNVTCKPNVVTILTGDLFGGSGTNGAGGNITLSADTSWDATPITKSFP